MPAVVARPRVRTRAWRTPVWLRVLVRRRRSIGIALGLAASVSGAWAVWHAGIPAQIAAQSRVLLATVERSAGFVVRDVTVEGREWTPPDDLRAALNVQRGDALASFSPKAAKQRLEAIGWVREADVTRQLPDAIHIRITERRPFALWQRDGVMTVVDRDGVVLTDQMIGRFANLPLVVGDAAALRAGGLLDMMGGEPDLFARVTSAVRIGDRRWDIHFDTGVVAMLPEQGTTEAWKRLAALYRETAVLDRHLMAVDLRQPDRLVVRLEPAAPPVAKPKPAGPLAKKPRVG